jgi:hypothetical protein
VAKQHVRPKRHEDHAAATDEPTQKRALAEALRHLGPNASPSALARFVKEQYGMQLTFRILVQKAGTVREPATPPAPRARCA